MPAYLTGVSNTAVKAVAHDYGIGLLIQPGNSYHLQTAAYPMWAADNGAYKKGARHESFDFAAWAAWVDSILPTVDQVSCLFFTCPDAIDVSPDGRDVIGYADETLRRAREWLPWLRARGLRTALVAQDGMEDLDAEIPWELVDVVFLGGSTEWKTGAGAAKMAAIARARGKRVHMGRVNSGKRFTLAGQIGCDTADGTFLGFGPDKNLPRLLRWPGMAPALAGGRADA
jgi:hypothetical protein